MDYTCWLLKVWKGRGGRWEGEQIHMYLVLYSLRNKIGCVTLAGDPVYIGQAVLELSKLIMYQLRYIWLRGYERKLGGSIKVVASDTDSFFLSVRNINIRDQLVPAMMADGLLDTSNYPQDHPHFSNAYRAALGCVKGL